jgi:cellulase/cellobiase CelA1
VINKNWQDIPPDPAFVEQEISRLNEAVDHFAQAMKTKLAQKAREGWTGWDDQFSADKIYTTMLAHAAGIPLARGQEVDIANLAMMLWRFNLDNHDKTIDR